MPGPPSSGSSASVGAGVHDRDHEQEARAITKMSSIPFFSLSEDDSVRAFWYNTPHDFIRIPGVGEIKLRPSLDVYGRSPGERVELDVSALDAGGSLVFERRFRIARDGAAEDYSVSFWGDTYRLSCPVEELGEPLASIAVRTTPNGGHGTDLSIECQYHRLHGRMTNLAASCEVSSFPVE